MDHLWRLVEMQELRKETWRGRVSSRLVLKSANIRLAKANPWKTHFDG
jgi:hypothetical protein